jgi:hypothetical protein
MTAVKLNPTFNAARPAGSTNHLSGPAAMITGCPSCATHDNLPARRSGGDTWMSSCPTCGHELLEAKAIEIFDDRAERPLMLTADRGADLDDEARRLAEAARATAERHRELRASRRAARRGWTMLAVACLLPLAGAAAFPESVTRAAPAAARIYSLAGMEVNAFGFTIRDAASQLQMDSGVPLLAVRGEVVNVTNTAQPVPALRFVLRDESGSETYAWTLDGVGTRKVEPGEATSFLTRVAAPPAHVQDVEIRFARGD